MLVTRNIFHRLLEARCTVYLFLLAGSIELDLKEMETSSLCY